MYQLNMLVMSNSRLVEVMNAKPFNPDAFLAGHKQATLKRRQHHTYSDAISLRTTTRGGRGKVGHRDRNFILI